MTAAGSATLRFVPSPGSHSYKAVFQGTTQDTASSSAAMPLTVTGTGSASPVTIAQSGSAGNYTLTATISGAKSALPTGTVSFEDTTNANYVLATAPLGAGSGSSGTPGLGFKTSALLPTNPYPQAVAVADFNGDGILDLVLPVYSIATPLSDISVLLGNGDGTFSAAPATPVTGDNAGSVAVGDFNADGKADIALTLPDSNEVVVLLGAGDGSFTLQQTIPDIGGPFYLTTADFNGDGVADLAVANPGGGDITILLGKGDGTFTPTSVSPSAPEIVCLVAGDFNGDGKTDLALLNQDGIEFATGTVTMLEGNGDGTFTPTSLDITTGQNPIYITTADLNADGKADLIVANTYVDTEKSGSLSVLLGKGDGTFTAAASLATGQLPYAVAVGDFNGDSIPDLASSDVGSNTSSVFLGKGDGSFQAPLSPSTNVNPLFAAAGDFNGDGLSDIAIANNYPSGATVLLSQFTESATASASGISPVGTGAHLVDASYSGDTNYAAGVSATTSLTAEPVSTTLALSASPTSSNAGQQVALTATLTPSLAQNHAASGSVTFLNGTTTLGTGSLTSGVATLNVSSLPAGSDSLTATYAGDTNFTSATSSAITETVAAVDYTIAVAPTTLTIAAGSSGTSTITVTPTGGFNQALQLACSGLPANTLCTFNPTSITPNGAAVTSSFSIVTNVNTQTASLTPASPSTRLPLQVGSITFAGLLGIFGLRRRKSKNSWQRHLSLLLCLGAAAIGLTLSGCGGKVGPIKIVSPVTPAGTSNVTITASGTAAGTPTHTTTLTLTVTSQSATN